MLDRLAALGRTFVVGSVATGLMVWRDVDVVVDARGATPEAAWEAMLPLVVRSDSVKYGNEIESRRYYFVVRLRGWKLDVSAFSGGVPADVEPFQRRLLASLDDDLRLTILRLKEAWRERPDYPETVGAYEIYSAVLDHGVRTPEELEAHLA